LCFDCISFDVLTKSRHFLPFLLSSFSPSFLFFFTSKSDLHPRCPVRFALWASFLSARPLFFARLRFFLFFLAQSSCFFPLDRTLLRCNRTSAFCPALTSPRVFFFYRVSAPPCGPYSYVFFLFPLFARPPSNIPFLPSSQDSPLHRPAPSSCFERFWNLAPPFSGQFFARDRFFFPFFPFFRISLFGFFFYFIFPFFPPSSPVLCCAAFRSRLKSSWGLVCELFSLFSRPEISFFPTFPFFRDSGGLTFFQRFSPFPAREAYAHRTISPADPFQKNFSPPASFPPPL